MNSSRPLLSSLPTKTPRRRVRASHLPSNVPPSRDLIGPPCPLSNLRPVYYAPLFPSLHNPSTWSTSFASSPSSELTTTATSNPHPYSLSEFPSTNSLSHSPRQQKLSRLKQKLHSEDLEYRLARYRFDNFNQDFWVRMNTKFLESRNAYIASLRPSSTSGSSLALQGKPQAGEVDLAPFYALHLARTKKIYQEYNTKLWRMQAKLIGLAVRDVVRRIRWNWAVWWAGGEK
ncbi:uncharacterized protein JCM6883_002853 [Sporobolomyces salmoneus]|uniref:uncharacterized protein n=1 Tax=Sporobolomyces salmoneus TaxID=183962 RepID=UPI00316C162D